MKRMKTFLIYALCIIGFFIFSEIMININLESTYQNIGRKDRISQVNIYQAQATKINGRIKGHIYNDLNNKIESNYVRIDLYSSNNNLLGSKYIDVSNMREKETRQLELYFKVQDVEYYEVKFTDEKEDIGSFEELFRDLTDSELRWGLFLTFLMIW